MPYRDKEKQKEAVRIWFNNHKEYRKGYDRSRYLIKKAKKVEAKKKKKLKV